MRSKHKHKVYSRVNIYVQASIKIRNIGIIDVSMKGLRKLESYLIKKGSPFLFLLQPRLRK